MLKNCTTGAQTQHVWLACEHGAKTTRATRRGSCAYLLAQHFYYCKSVLFVVSSKSVRVHLDEQVYAKDCEVNQLKSVKLDLDKDLRDCRAVVERVSIQNAASLTVPSVTEILVQLRH